MLVDSVSNSVRAAPPPRPVETPPPLDRTKPVQAGGEGWMRSLQTRADAGEPLTPVEQGTLARWLGSTAPAAALPAAWERIPDAGGPIETPKEHLSKDQVKDESHRILSVGDRTLWGDDYDKRLDAFAESMGKLDQSSRQALMAQILKDDPGAFSSWLNGGKLLDMRNSGRVSYAETSAVVDGFAGAYNAGKAGDQFSAIDFLAGGTSLTGIGPIRPNEMKNFAALLDAGSPALTDAMREKMGRALLGNYVDTKNNVPVQSRQVALAMQIMRGAYDQSMAGRVYGGFGAGDREKIFGAASSQVGSPGGGDPLEILVKSVSLVGNDAPGSSPSASGDTWSDIETDLVRYANTADGGVAKSALFWDSTHIVKGRAEAFSQLLQDHGKVILNALTDPREQQVDPTGGDPDTTLVVGDNRALANLLRATALAPDNPAHQQVNDAIRSYIAEQHKALGDGKQVTVAGQAAINRLSWLGAAAQFSGKQLTGDLAADKAAQEQLIGFCADIALAAVPLGSKVSGAATKALENTFGSKPVATALRNASGALIDKGTGMLTEEGKKAIAAAVSGDSKDVIDNIQASNLLKKAIFATIGRDNAYYYPLNQDMQDNGSALERK